MKSAFNLTHSNNNTNNTNNNENKGTYYKKKELSYINNQKSARTIYDNNNRYVNTQINDNMISHRNLNNYQRRSVSKPQVSNPNKQRYQSIANTERNLERKKKFLYPSAYEGNQTEVMTGKFGNSKFLNKNKNRNNVTNNYFGPIDIKNIVIGNSVNEVNEILIDILQKNRVKFWNMSNLKFYCNKNGENFIIEIFILSNKLVDKDGKNKEENEISEFDINSKNENENDEDKEDNENDDSDKKNNDNKRKKMFYITILSKDSSNRKQAKNINKIINKKFGEIIKK